LSINSERADEERIDEHDNQGNDDGTDVNPSQLSGRDEATERPEHRLGQPVEDKDDRVKRGDIDPGENSPDDDDPQVEHEDEMQNLRQGSQKIPEEDHLTVSM
jgi:hypothetical protein